MNASFPIESVSPVRMLVYLRLSIEEAKLVRSIVKSKCVINRQEVDHETRERLLRLNREIDYLEEQVAQLNAQLDQRREAASWI